MQRWQEDQHLHCHTLFKRFKDGKWENYASFDEGTKPIVLETEFGHKFSDWTTNLNDLVKDLKPDKRGVVFGYKKGADIGHVFNVVNEKGVIKYLDGQTGKRAKLVYDQYKFYQQIKRNYYVYKRTSQSKNATICGLSKQFNNME